MKILLLDDDYIIIEQLKSLIQLENDWKLVSSNQVNYNEIDLIIVNNFNEEYNKILEDILDKNPKIRTISVSDKLENKLSKGCEYCTSHYNRIRLIKPIKLQFFYETIKNFDNIPSCPLMDAFKNIENIIPILIREFKTLLYDETSRVVSSTDNIESKEYTMQLLSFLTLLDENKIQYTFLDGSRVKIDI